MRKLLPLSFLLSALFVLLILLLPQNTFAQYINCANNEYAQGSCDGQGIYNGALCVRQLPNGTTETYNAPDGKTCCGNDTLRTLGAYSCTDRCTNNAGFFCPLDPNFASCPAQAISGSTCQYSSSTTFSQFCCNYAGPSPSPTITPTPTLTPTPTPTPIPVWLINGVVFNDVNANGFLDGPDIVYSSGAQVDIADLSNGGSPFGSYFTDNFGFYETSRLWQNGHQIRADLKTSPPPGCTLETTTPYDFFIYSDTTKNWPYICGPTPTPGPLYMIYGNVYFDNNANGVKDGNDTFYTGASIGIQDTDNTIVSGSYITNSVGYYETSAIWQAGHFISVTLNTIPAGCYVYNNTNPNNFWITFDTTVNFPIVCGGPTPIPPTPVPTFAPTPTPTPTLTPTPTPICPVGSIYTISGTVTKSGGQNPGKTLTLCLDPVGTAACTSGTFAYTDTNGIYSFPNVVSGTSYNDFLAPSSLPGGYSVFTQNPVPISSNSCSGTANFTISTGATPTPTPN